MYLQRRSSGYYFRIAVPKKLQHVYERKEITLSLGTYDRNEAKLKVLPIIHEHLIMFNSVNVQDIKCKTRKVEHDKEEYFEKIHHNTFIDVYKKYLNERKLREKSEADFRTVVNRFVKICSNKEVNTYTKNDIVKFKDILLQYPRRISKSDSELPIDKILTKYKNCKDTLSGKTIKEKYLAVLNVIFGYAVSNGMCKSNCTDGVNVIVQKTVAPPRLPFSNDELKRLFKSKIFTEKVDNKHMEYRYLILLGFFSGCRLEELARLKVQDVGTEDGISYLHIRPDVSSGHLLKNFSSIRRVPLPSSIFENWDFEKYLKSVSGETYFFPEMNTRKPVKGSVSSAFSKWFSRHIKSIGITSTALSFHSFRHTYKRLCRSAGIPKSISDVLQGHASADVSDDYGKDCYGSGYPLRVLYDAVERITDFQKLKFSKF